MSSSELSDILIYQLEGQRTWVRTIEKRDEKQGEGVKFDSVPSYRHYISYYFTMDSCWWESN